MAIVKLKNKDERNGFQSNGSSSENVEWSIYDFFLFIGRNISEIRGTFPHERSDKTLVVEARSASGTCCNRLNVYLHRFSLSLQFNL